MTYITVFDNNKILPANESIRLDGCPIDYLGEPTYRVGSLIVWSIDDLRVIVSRNVLTTAP